MGLGGGGVPGDDDTSCPLCRLRPALYAVLVERHPAVVCGRCALRRGRFWSQSVVTGAIVGSLLTGVERLPMQTILRAALTFMVPFLVSMSTGVFTSRRLGTAQRRMTRLQETATPRR